MAWFEGLWNTEYYPTQYKLIASNGVARRVVRSLRLWEDPRFGGGWQPTQGDVAPTPEEDEAAISNLSRRLRVTVSPEGGTELVNINFVHADPEFAAKIVNEWAAQYIALGIEQRSTQAGAAASFFSGQIEDIRNRIAAKNRELNAVTRQSQSLSLDAEEDLADKRLRDLESDRNAAVTQRVALEAAYQQLQSQSAETIARTSASSELTLFEAEVREAERTVATLREKYREGYPDLVDAERVLTEAKSAYTGAVNRAARAARQKARSEYQAALSREDNLAEEIAQVRASATLDSNQASEAGNLRRELQGLNQQLLSLQQQQAASAATSDLSEAKDTNVHVIERATIPGAPFQPNLQRSAFSGTALGVLFGIVLVLGVHYLDNTIKTPEQAERVLGLPTLGIIPDANAKGRRYGYRYGKYGYRYNYNAQSYGDYAGENTLTAVELTDDEERKIELMPLDRPHSVLSEAYRSFRAALLMSSAEKIEAISITSADAGEGKTSTVTNLAVVMAQLGKSVLVIDADLRRPRLHKVFEISNRIGTVTALTGGASLAQATQVTQVPNLTVMTSGPIPPNPSELLSSAKMDSLIDEARRLFDFVIIDAPPVLAVADPMIVARHVDGLVLTVASGRLRRDHARAARSRLQLAGIKVLGLVLNRFSPDGSGSRYRRYRYHYDSRDQTRDSSAA